MLWHHNFSLVLGEEVTVSYGAAVLSIAPYCENQHNAGQQTSSFGLFEIMHLKVFGDSIESQNH